jgi:DNA invertase Pin-like site-specific DNA recombinase
MKRAALYCRVSTVDQHPETQLGELRQFAANKGFQVVGEYTDHGYSGVRARRPELDRMMDDARRHRFDVLLVWSCDRLARSTKHLLQTIDELNGMGIQFLSQREAIDTEGPLGRAILVIVSAMAELERCIIIERVRAGMRRARLEGRQIGRSRLDVNRQQVIDDRRSGMSLTQVAKKHGISRASVCRLMKEANVEASHLLCRVPADHRSDLRLYLAAGLDGCGMATAVCVRLRGIAGVSRAQRLLRGRRESEAHRVNALKKLW